MSVAGVSPDFEALYRQLQALPDHLVGEILAHELVVRPRPTLPHANAAGVIGVDVAGAFHRATGGPRGPGGWIILPEPELHLGMNVVSPDLAGWTRTRLPRLPRAPWLSLAPDWVCEVLSSRTASRDRGEKRRIYREAGVRWMWLVDPRDRTLEAYRLEGVFWTLIGSWAEDARVCAEPFEAVEIELAAWWEAVEEEPESER